MKKSYRNTLSLALPCLLAALLGLMLSNKSSDENHALLNRTEQRSADVNVAALQLQIAQADESLTALRNLRNVSLTDEQVVSLTKRRETMRQLMKVDPAFALANAISWSDYEALPEEAKGYVEQPFSGIGDLSILPNCGAISNPLLRDQPAQSVRLLLGRNEYDVVMESGKLPALSKEKLPVAGIQLDGVAVVADAPLRMASLADIEAAKLPAGAPDATVDLWTGEPLIDEPITLIAGGKWFQLNSQQSANELSAFLAKINQLEGPFSGAQAFFDVAAGTTERAIDQTQINNTAVRLSYPYSATTNRMLLIRLDFADAPESVVVDPVEQAAFLNGRVATGFWEISYGKLNFVADVSADVIRLGNRGLYSSTYGAASTNHSLLYSDAVDAYCARYSLSRTTVENTYRHICVTYKAFGMTPLLGVLGGRATWIDADQLSYYGYVHELGHNLTLNHATTWNTTNGTVVGAGTQEEYGNSWDPMGSGGYPDHYHAQAKVRVGWFDATNWDNASVTGSGVRRIYRFDHPATNPANSLRAVRVNKGGANDFYWIDYRKGVTNNPWFSNGVVLQWQASGANNSRMLDTTPNSVNGRADSALTIGRTYSDSVAGVHITPMAQGGSGADAWIDVNVQVGNAPSNQAPTVSVSAASSIKANEPLLYTASATDADGDTLAYAWNWGDGTPSTNAAQASHRWLAAGTYTVTVTVSDMKGGSGTASMNVTVTDILSQWTEQTAFAGQDMYEVTYKHGRFIASDFWRLRFSVDGSTWQEVSQSGAYSTAAADDSLNFVAVGQNGRIQHSLDGRTWTTRPVVTPNKTLNHVVYGNGTFVAVGETGAVARSTDGGLTWTNHTIAGADTLHNVTYGNGIFMAYAYFQLWASADGGVTWVNRWDNLPNTAGSGISLRRIHFHNDCFFLYGNNSDVRVSEDGLSWDRSYTVFNGSHTLLRAVSHGDRLIGLGYLEDSGLNPAAPALLNTTDGYQWFESNTSPVVLPLDLDFTYADGRYFGVHGEKIYATARDYPSNQAPVVSITGPTSATVLQANSFSANVTDADGDAVTLMWDFLDGSLLEGAVNVSKSYQVGGNFTIRCTATDSKGGVTVATHNITIADPLNTWVNGEVAPSRSMTTVHYLNGRYIASSNGNMHFSLDGVSWTSQAMRDGDFRGRAIAWDGTRYVMVGEWYSGALGWHARAWTSVDGKTWSVDGSFVHADSIWDLTYKNGTFLAVGENGLVARSTDGGLTWSTSAISGAATLRAVTATNSGYVAIDSNQVWTSVDGITWTERTSGLQNFSELKDIAANGDTVAITGWLTGIQVSLDGGVTYTRKSISGGNDDLFRLTFGNGVFVASGNVGGNPSIVLSRNGIDWFKNAVTNVPSNTAMTFGNSRFLGVQGSNGDTYYSDSFFPNNQVPSGSIAGPATANARAAVSFSANATDADGDPLVYIWNFNDGQPLLDGTNVSKTYLIGGSYTVNLTITDSHGGVTQLTHNITVEDPLAPAQWIKRTTPVTSTRGLSDIAVGQSSTGAEQLFAVGNFYAFASADGTNWSTIVNNDDLRDMRGVIYTGGRYLMCGEKYAFDGTGWKGAVFAATNIGGANTIADVYRNTTAANTGALNDIAIGGSNIVVAVGNGGRITRSADNGTTWTEVTHGLTTNQLKAVAYHSGKFVATGNNLILTSDDEGVTWSNQTTALGVGSVWVESAAYVNDRFLFGGYLAHIRSSTNQLASLNTITLSPGQRTLGYAYQNGIYLAVGELDSSGTTPSNAVSIDGVNWSRVTMTAQEKRKAVVPFKGTFVTVGEKLSIWQSGSVLIPQLLVKNASNVDLPNASGIHEFGRIVPSSSTSTTFSLHNTGSGPLQVTNLQTSGDFTVSGLTLPATIPVGGNATITVQFASSGSGVKNGSLSITSDGASGQAYVVNLLGLANTPPVFSGMSITVAQGDQNVIQDAKILMRSSDAENHTMSVVGIAQNTTAQGGSISRAAGQVTYQAAAAYVGSDSFTVTLSDGFSTTEALIQVNVIADPGMNPNNPPKITMNGATPSVTFFGIPGRTYGIQRSTNLTNWSQIGTAQVLPSGQVQFSDAAPPPGSAFYRIVFPAQ